MSTIGRALSDLQPYHRVAAPPSRSAMALACSALAVLGLIAFVGWLLFV